MNAAIKKILENDRKGKIIIKMSKNMKITDKKKQKKKTFQ